MPIQFCKVGRPVYIQFHPEKTEKQVKLNKFFRFLHEQLIKNVTQFCRFSVNKNLIKQAISNNRVFSKTGFLRNLAKNANIKSSLNITHIL